MPTRNIDLTTADDHFVEEQIGSGRFQNASEVMRAGLRLLVQQTAADREKLAALRALATEAFSQLDRGEGTMIDDSTALARHIADLGRKAAKQASHSTEIEKSESFPMP
jgi:antitoxin ParD1/3/4